MSEQNYSVKLHDLKEEELCNKNGFFNGKTYDCVWKSLNHQTNKVGYLIQTYFEGRSKFITVYANEFTKV